MMKRIVVVGTSCAGKTTFAKVLAQKLGARPIDIDDYHWSPGWKENPPAEYLPRLQKAMDCPAWVVSGNYMDAREMVWGSADTVVWLDYSFATVLLRAIRRTIKRNFTGEIVCNGNRETFRHSFLSRDSIILWVLSTYHRRIREFEALMIGPRYSHLEFIRLKNQGETDRFITSV